MPMTIRTSISKLEIKFQNGGRPFSETGSSFISALHWGISSKFSRRIDFLLLKLIPSLNLNREVHFRLYGRYLKKSISRHNTAADRPITTKVWQAGVQWHADDYTYVEIETRNRIPIPIWTMALTRCYKTKVFFYIYNKV